MKEIPYTYPKIEGIPQPRFRYLAEGLELHFDPVFVASKDFKEYWYRLTGKEFPPMEKWPND
jgi:hypothetical protein